MLWRQNVLNECECVKWSEIPLNAKYQERSYFKRNRVIWVHKNSKHKTKTTTTTKKLRFMKIHKNIAVMASLALENKKQNYSQTVHFRGHLQ